MIFSKYRKCLFLSDNEYISFDDVFEFLNLKNYFEENEIRSIQEKLLKKLNSKNFHKIKIESFILSLFQENLKETPKFLIDFFIRNENNLNNYMEIFSKNLKKMTDLNLKFLGKNGNEKNDLESKNKSGELSDRANATSDFKKFFELNFKKNIFTTDNKNRALKAKIFTKILKTIFRGKGITLNYKLIDLESFNSLNESFDINSSKIEKISDISDSENQSKRVNNFLNRSFFIKSPLKTLESPLISNQTHINEIFRNLDKFEFNIFDFSRTYGRENLMSLVTIYILEKSNLTKYLSMSKFENFIAKTRKKYMENPYHNEVHAVDVLHTCYLFNKKSNFQEFCQLDHIDILAYYLASLLHDIGHPGLNNSYHQNKQTKFALRYNDKSILENYHSYKGLRLFSKSSSNILENLTEEEKKVFRKRLIGCILATDMAFHNNVLNKLSQKIEKIKDAIEAENQNSHKNSGRHIKENHETKKNYNGLVLEETDESLLVCQKRLHQFIEKDLDQENIQNQKNQIFELQQDFLNFLVHSGDVSNPSKDLSVYSIWTKLVMQEFFNQGDLERSENLPISYLCDRATTNVPKSQVGFINFIVAPLFKTLSFYLPSVAVYDENVRKNLEYFKGIEEFDIEYEI